MTKFSQQPTMRQKRTSVRNWVVSTSCRVSLLCLVVLLVGTYVVQTNSMATKGYDMNDIQKQITNLERENQKLAFDIATNGSMKSIQDRLAGTELVSAGRDIEYMNTFGTAVARR